MTQKQKEYLIKRIQQIRDHKLGMLTTLNINVEDYNKRLERKTPTEFFETHPWDKIIEEARNEAGIDANSYSSYSHNIDFPARDFFSNFEKLKAEYKADKLLMETTKEEKRRLITAEADLIGDKVMFDSAEEILKLIDDFIKKEF